MTERCPYFEISTDTAWLSTTPSRMLWSIRRLLPRSHIVDFGNFHAIKDLGILKPFRGKKKNLQNGVTQISVRLTDIPKIEHPSQIVM